MTTNLRSRKCFVTYHHGNDQQYVTKLRNMIADMELTDHSLKEDISYLSNDAIYRQVREKMLGCSVTIILIGRETGRRKWIDWELWASLRPYKNADNPARSFKAKGIVGVYLPVKEHDVPARLMDNIYSGYAVMVEWRKLDTDLERKVAEAYTNRTYWAWKIQNSRPLRQRNS